jgi:hypothetical protein
MITQRDTLDRTERFKEVSLPASPPPTDYYFVDDLRKVEEREVRDRWVDAK